MHVSVDSTAENVPRAYICDCYLEYGMGSLSKEVHELVQHY